MFLTFSHDITHQLASEMLLLGRNVSATEAATRFGLYVFALADFSCYCSSRIILHNSVNKVVPKTEVLRTALSWAAQIVDNSPESVQSTKKALLLGSQHGNVEEATVAHIWSQENRRAIFSENRKVWISLLESGAVLHSLLQCNIM